MQKSARIAEMSTKVTRVTFMFTLYITLRQNTSHTQEIGKTVNTNMIISKLLCWFLVSTIKGCTEGVGRARAEGVDP